MSVARILALPPLALALALSAPSRAQAPAPLVPISGSMMVGPLLLLVIPLAIHLSRPDKTRVHELEAREDWAGLAELASQRLLQHAGDPSWLELRGRALQRQGRCTEAIPDLQAAFEGQLAGQRAADAALSAGLALGMCQMAAPDLAAAAATFERLHQLAPREPEPAYNLGVIRTIQGDRAGAEAALAALEARGLPQSASLRAYMAASSPQPERREATPVTPPPREPVAQGRLDIGSRSLQLPPADWYLASRSESTIRGGTAQSPTRTIAVPFVTLRAYGLSADGALAAAVEFSANPQQSFGTLYWNADDGCAVPNTLHVQRFRRGFDQPECVYVRLLAPAGDGRWGPMLKGCGTAAPALAYEVHYERYGTGWTVAATYLLPSMQMAGDMAAVQWAHALATQVRPMARATRPTTAMTPVLTGLSAVR